MQWYGTLNESMTDKTLTLREIYEYASLENVHIKKTAISFNILLVLQKLRWYKNNDILAGSHVPTNVQMYRQNSEKALWGGGGGNGEIAPQHPPPPPPPRLR